MRARSGPWWISAGGPDRSSSFVDPIKIPDSITVEQALFLSFVSQLLCGRCGSAPIAIVKQHIEIQRRG